MISRRNVLKSGGLMMACLTFPVIVRAKIKTHIIKMESDEDGALVWFDPIGLYVEPGDRIRWIVHHNVHTVAAYHPDNDNHALRIPEKAQPWDSDFLVEPGKIFEVTLIETGVYDYYCMPHEAAGMVGRIVVGQSSGPGAKAFDYHKKLRSTLDWQDVPEAAQCVLPTSDQIIKQKKILFDQTSLVAKCNL